MKVLVACEFSGIVRDAFIAEGHDAVSCDLLPSESWNSRRFHYCGDVRDVLHRHWDLMIAHPPCTHTAVSGARWFKDEGKVFAQNDAIDFFLELVHAPIHRICVEHPVSVISTVYRKPDQYIQPWQFGHGETKKTGLWLKNLPLLEPTDIVEGRENRVHREAPSKDRWKNRSRFYSGIAKAMAEQWSFEE